MPIVTDEMVSKRLRTVDQSQESIETASLWIVHHHKDSTNVIVNGWINTFRLVSEGHRLALLYVANDVCQKAKHKPGHESLVSAFVPHIINAIAISRGCETIKVKLKRMLSIWQERRIFAAPVLAEMKSTLQETSETDDAVSMEFDLTRLINDLDKFQKIESAIDKARTILSRGNFDFQSQIKDRLKDRSGGAKFLNEVDQSCKKMCEFVTALEQQMKQHHRLIDLLENAKRFFSIQLRDATVVNDAYQKFGKGIENVKQELEEMMRTGAYLGASPPRDAPSPQPNDDPFIAGVEMAIQEMRRPGARDIIESSDMDVDEDSTPNYITTASTIQGGNSAGTAEIQRMLNVLSQASTKKTDPRRQHPTGTRNNMEPQHTAAPSEISTGNLYASTLPGTTTPPAWIPPPNFVMGYPPPGMPPVFGMPPPPPNFQALMPNGLPRSAGGSLLPSPRQFERSTGFFNPQTGSYMPRGPSS